MKATIAISILSLAMFATAPVLRADAGELWAKNCQSCHAKDGSGNTTMGKKNKVKDYSKEQGFSDAEATKAIKDGITKDGKEVMKPFKEKLSDADVKALVGQIRSFKK